MSTATWVANYGSGSVMQVEPKRGSVINTVKVGKSPASVIFDGTSIWVANGGSNSVRACRCNLRIPPDTQA